MGDLLQFTAYRIMGELEVPIISVLATDEEEAADRIEEELNREGRRHYLAYWDENNREVRQTGV